MEAAQIWTSVSNRYHELTKILKFVVLQITKNYFKSYVLSRKKKYFDMFELAE